MRVKFRAKFPAKTAQAVKGRRYYPLRVSSFAVSLATHCLAVTVAMMARVPSHPAATTSRPIYEELIKPRAHELVYYDFRKKVPDVVPRKKVGTVPDPRGAELSDQAIVATSRKPQSKQVFISVPAPQIEIHQDLPTPLMVASLATSLPPPPQPAPQPKKFVPPPPSKQEPRLAIQTPVLTQAPVFEPSAPSAPFPAATLNLSMLTGPPSRAPEAPTARTGDAPANIVAASLHPSEDTNSRVPNGERTGSFSKAPTRGAAASGDTDASAALTVPDLTIRRARPEPAPPSPAPTRQLLYAERIRGLPLSSLSVPLRPASRMIPQAVDARFQGRNVYTIVVPMENMPSYAGDWIMWFADRESKVGQTPVVRAPIPYRKLEPVEEPPLQKQAGERVQFSATIGKGGKLDGITLISKTTAAVQRAVFQDLSSWEFQPATRDGAPVDVDVVLEIPFNMATTLARSMPQ